MVRDASLATLLILGIILLTQLPGTATVAEPLDPLRLECETRFNAFGDDLTKAEKKEMKAYAKALKTISKGLPSVSTGLKSYGKLAKLFAKSFPGDPSLSSLLAQALLDLQAAVENPFNLLSTQVDGLDASKAKAKAQKALASGQAILDQLGGISAAVVRAKLLGKVEKYRQKADKAVAGLIVVVPKTWYRDLDEDGYGDPLVTLQVDEQPPGYVDNDLDPRDNDPASHPGASEIDDGIDNDYDGQTDEDMTQWYVDGDDDGHGSNDLPAIWAEAQPDGHVEFPGDCDDLRPGIHPGAAEIPGDFLDNDCDGETDESE